VKTLLVAAAAALALLAGAAPGGGAPAAFGFERIATGLADPLYVTSAPGDPGTLYVVEQGGRIVTVRDGAVTGTFADFSDRTRVNDQEQGLLGLAFSPQYATNHLFYVNYTDVQGDTRIVETNAQTRATRELLHVVQPHPNHNGGQLQFDRAGFLYTGMGDGGSVANVVGNDPENRAQDMKQKLGKMLRIKPTSPGATWQMIALGLRNPWRFSFDRKTGDMWIGDVGAGAQEEIDFRPKSKIAQLANYGWSRYEGTSVYGVKKPLSKKGTLVAPVWTYSHSDGNLCSVIGGYVYRGSAVPTARGRYFFGDFCLGAIWSVKAGPKGRAGQPVRLSSSLPTLSSFGEDANGELYATTIDGSLYALR